MHVAWQGTSAAAVSGSWDLPMMAVLLLTHGPHCFLQLNKPGYTVHMRSGGGFFFIPCSTGRAVSGGPITFTSRLFSLGSLRGGDSPVFFLNCLSFSFTICESSVCFPVTVGVG